MLGTVLIIYLIMSAYFQNLNPTMWSTVPATEEEEITGVAGMFDMKTKGMNSLDLTASLTTAVNYTCAWYGIRSGGSVPLGTGDVTVEVTEEDAGYTYGIVKVVSGQSYYVDYAGTLLKNQRAKSVSYSDIDGDGYKEFTFKFSMADIPKVGAGNPTVYFYPYFFAYQKPTLSNLSNVTAIGTAEVTQYIEDYLYFASVRKAWALVRITISLTTVDTTKMQLGHLNVPGVGYKSGDELGVPIVGATTITWTWTSGVNPSLYGADYVQYPTNAINKFYTTVEAKLKLAGSDDLLLTVTAYGLDTTSSLETTTDTLYLQA